MASDDEYLVQVRDVASRPTATVMATTTWQEFPGVWKELLDEVWACLRAGGITSGCPNVMLYLDDVPHVEVGVELTQPLPLTGRVEHSSLPAGEVAMTVQRGAFSDLRGAHRAIRDWCAAHERGLAGPRWEVYGRIAKILPSSRARSTTSCRDPERGRHRLRCSPELAGVAERQTQPA